MFLIMIWFELMTKTYTWFAQLGNLTSNFYLKIGVHLTFEEENIYLLINKTYLEACCLWALDVDWAVTKPSRLGSFFSNKGDAQSFFRANAHRPKRCRTKDSDLDRRVEADIPEEVIPYWALSKSLDISDSGTCWLEELKEASQCGQRLSEQPEGRWVLRWMEVLLRTLAFLPKGKDGSAISLFLTHSSITSFSWKVFGSRGEGEVAPWVSEQGIIDSLSVVVSSHTPCIPHLSNLPYSLKLKGRRAQIKHSSAQNIT